MSHPPLIEALLDPRRYPHPVDAVEVAETHISWVLLAGDFAYKIKKPLTLPFLDYGTLDRRRACCEAELRLNRRHAAELYLDVVPIGGSVEAPLIGAEPALEFAVKMRRFDEAQRLDHVCARGELTPAHMRVLAHEIADFHRAAAVAPADARFGLPERVLMPALANIDALRSLLPEEHGHSIAALEEWTLREFARCEPALAHRKLAGCIRECHGDLHLGNLILAGERIVPFDCIEFNDDFRWIDVASELAFTLVDLLDHGQPALAAALLDEWLARTGDADALRVLRFHAVYRALVRAKVAAIRASQEEDAATAEGDRTSARHYIALAAKLSTPPTPTLTITHGVSGSGKSHAARARVLGDVHCATVRLRSDVERKRLFGLDALAASGSSLDAGIYTPEAHAATYRRLEELAALALQAGWSVVVDAAFLRRAERDGFRHLAAREGVPFAILACTAPVEELRRRIAARKGDASEATLAVLDKQLTWVEPPAADELSAPG